MLAHTELGKFPAKCYTVPQPWNRTAVEVFLQFQTKAYRFLILSLEPTDDSLFPSHRMEAMIATVTVSYSLGCTVSAVPINCYFADPLETITSHSTIPRAFPLPLAPGPQKSTLSIKPREVPQSIFPQRAIERLSLIQMTLYAHTLEFPLPFRRLGCWVSVAGGPYSLSQQPLPVLASRVHSTLQTT